MAMGDPAKEPGNPDGCRISKKQINKMASSLASLADMFARAATLIESAINSIANSVKKVGKGTGATRRAGGAQETITTPEQFDKSVQKIKKAQAKKEEKVAKEIYDANIAAMESAISAAEQEEKEIIKAAMRGLSARNAIRLAAEDEATSAAEQEEKEIIKAAMRGLSARNAIRLAAEKSAIKAAKEEEKEITKAAIAGLSARNAIQRAKEEQQKQERKQIQDQENEIYKQAPIAFTIGKTLGFFVSNMADAIGASAKYFQGLFTKKEAPQEVPQEVPQEYSLLNDAHKSLAEAEAEIADAYQSEIDFIKAHEDAIADATMALQGFSSAINDSDDALIARIAEEEDLALKPAAGQSKKPKGFARGGKAMGTDTVPAMLTPGEMVVNKKATKQFGPLLEGINNGKIKGYARGGMVGPARSAIGGAGRAVGGAAAGFASGLDASGYTAAATAVRGLARAIPAATAGVQGLAIGILGPIDMFGKIVSSVGSFVDAVNPALMQQLSMAFKDLQAVIGAGLQPIIAAIIPIVRAFADKLQPVMQALMPTFDQLAQSMIKLSGPIITLIIEGFAALEPILAQVAAAIEAWAGILTALAPIISTVFKEIIYRIVSLASTFQWLIGKIVSLIPGTGNLGKSMMDAADASQKSADAYYNGTSKVQQAVNAEVKRGASTGAAARQASFTGISDFGKNLMQQAFSSSTQAAALKTAEYSEKTYNELTKMNAQMGRANPAVPAAGVRRAGP